MQDPTAIWEAELPMISILKPIPVPPPTPTPPELTMSGAQAVQ
jgi:hypothetical protein